MKVLFAVSNENISEAIVKKYQKDYKEIISYKNVYYFNAIVKELQRDKTYDRIVISEDLEPFANNDYEAIDRFIFEKLDSISDEATSTEGEDTPIILICADRRTKSEQFLVKLFGIGIYSAILGQDRSIDAVTKLLKKPRTKKEAKIYYKIESEDVSYQAESEDTVSEVEIQNIRSHYKKLGKNEDAYVESFNNIASQYSDAQLKVIAKFLPLNVKAVLEKKSPKYQSIITFSERISQNTSTKQKTSENKKDALKIDFIENQLNKPKLTKPVIVPSAVNTKSVKKLGQTKSKLEDENTNVSKSIEESADDDIDSILEQIEPVENINYEKEENNIEEMNNDNVTTIENEELITTEENKRGRGRPKKVVNTNELQHAVPKRGRGRPKKNVNEENEKESKSYDESNENNNAVNLFELGNEEPEEVSTILPGVDDMEETEENTINSEDNNSNISTLPGFEEELNDTMDSFSNTTNTFSENSNINTNEIAKQLSPTESIENLISKDKKVVAFVGTSKNGTSFIINNLGELFSQMGINTAILDMTQNKNSYYIYTKNEESLRKVAYNSMDYLEHGTAEGIHVNRNLTVFTALPNSRNNEDKNAINILETLIRNYSIILIDCDFNTPIEYFNNAQEIYLVQSMDILTIQPLTAFLRDLKAKNILLQDKIKVIINKESKIRSLTPRVIIGGMAYYNDPSMSFMTELFNKDQIMYITIPLEEQVYTKYLAELVDCKISLSGYSKKFMQALNELAGMVYPLLNNKYKPNKSSSSSYEPPSTFSQRTNNTLDKMKNSY